MNINKYYKNLGNKWRKSFEEVNFHLSEAGDEEELQILLTALIVISTRILIINGLLKKEEEIKIDEKAVIDTIQNIESPQIILKAAIESFDEVRESQDASEWKSALTWIIRGFIDLNAVEYLLKENTGSDVLESARCAFEKAQSANHEVYYYILVWGQGILNLFEAWISNPFDKQQAKKVSAFLHIFEISLTLFRPTCFLRMPTIP